MPIDAEVLLEFENFGGFIREVSANISNGGMFIKTRYLKPVGTVVHFQFRLADNMELIRGTGTVVWTRWRDQGADAPAGMGIQFLDVDEPSQLLIAAIVEQHLQHGGTAFDLGSGAREAGAEVPPAGAGSWGEAARAESPPAGLPEIDFGALPGLEPGPAPAPEWSFASAAEELAPSPGELPPVAAEVAAGVAVAGGELSTPASEGGAGRRPTAPWPTLWTEPAPAVSPSDVMTPPEPDAPARDVLAAPEAPKWTPPAIPDRKPFSMTAPAERSGPRAGLVATALAVAVLGGAAYYFRGPLLGLLGPGAAPSPPAAARSATPPATAMTPASSPSPGAVARGTGTLREDVARAAPVASAALPSPAPAEPSPSVAANAAASAAASPGASAPVTRAPSAAASEVPGPTPSPVAAAPPAARPPAASGFAGLQRVRWQANAEGLLVLLECDGPLDASRFDRSRIEGPEPREVIRLLGVRRPFDQTRIAVGVGPLKQIRIGYHEGTRAELHIVLDLASPGAKAVSVEPQGSVLRIQLAGK